MEFISAGVKFNMTHFLELVIYWNVCLININEVLYIQTVKKPWKQFLYIQMGANGGKGGGG